MRNEFRDRPSEMPLANRNDPGETLFFDARYEPLREGSRIGRLIRRLHHPDPGLLEPFAHSRTPLRIPVTVSAIAQLFNPVLPKMMRPARRTARTIVRLTRAWTIWSIGVLL